MTPKKLLELAERAEIPGALQSGESLYAMARALRSYAELVAALEWRDGVSAGEYVERARIVGWPGLEES